MMMASHLLRTSLPLLLGGGRGGGGDHHTHLCHAPGLVEVEGEQGDASVVGRDGGLQLEEDVSAGVHLGRHGLALLAEVVVRAVAVER